MRGCICGTCHTCRSRERMRRVRSESHAEYRTYERAYRQQLKESNPEAYERTLARRREWAAKTEYDKNRDPQKIRARRYLQRAVREGKIERGLCEVCGVAETHGHHDDYSRPLDVRWLCSIHHAEAHRLCA